MHKLKSMRTRKPLEFCSYDHRARMSRLLNRARQVWGHFSGVKALLVINLKLLAVIFISHNFSDSVHAENYILNDNATDDVTLSSDDGQGSDRFQDMSDHASTTESLDSLNSTVVSNQGDALGNIEAFEAHLATAFTEANMNHQQIKKNKISKIILKALKTHDCFSTLHDDPRTILKTPNFSTPTLKIALGEYLHLGVEQGLSRILLSAPPEMIR
ncbi:unnamed protein product [Arctia plantaginis]|uniref:Uncharacterized protein n=1 Tax=Arctia plantaginis TaxID=874455 RepID=A0A8S1AUG2_ARCPL|nr:unnamed protein product [Arctia plantaginis]